MNDRSRRHRHHNQHHHHHHQTRRAHHPVQSAAPPQFAPSSSSSSTNHQQRSTTGQHSNGQQQQRPHPSYSYPNSGHRHPSAATNLSSMGHQSSSLSSSSANEDARCRPSICYSYLVAIVSSFLVVLGLYLSMTKFNIRYLYISLVGILFEAIGACIYCLSNIQASKAARRKSTINSDDFIHLSVANAAASGGSLINSNPQNNQPNGQQRQQSAGTITHILSNGTLTGRTSLDNTDSNVNNNNDDNRSTAIVMGDDGMQASQEISHDNGPASRQAGDGQTDSSQIPSCGVVGNSITILATVEDHHSGGSTQSNNELPKNQPFQVSPGETSDFSSSTSLLGAHRSPEEGDTQLTEASVRVAVDETDLAQPKNVSQISDNATSIPALSGESTLTSRSGSNHITIREIIQPSAPPPPPSAEPGAQPIKEELSTSSSSQQVNSLRQSDLINIDPQPSGSDSGGCGPSGLIPSDPSESVLALRKSVARSRHQQHQQRQANVRRTLVMGLSGEEEMIEIDEEDLDNMSILPPPYESIASETASNRQLQQQPFTEV